MAKTTIDTTSSVRRLVPSLPTTSRAIVVFITPRSCSCWACSCPSCSRFEPDILSEIIAHQAAEGDRAQPLHLLRHAVDEAQEDRDADPARLMHHRLHVPIHLLALRLVGLGPRRRQQLIELLVLP